MFHDKSMKRGSIAGVVSSVNKSLSQYYTTVAIQKSGQEIIDALKVVSDRLPIKIKKDGSNFNPCLANSGLHGMRV